MKETFDEILTHVHPISRREVLRRMGSLIHFDEQKARACFEIKSVWLKHIVRDEIKIKDALRAVYGKEFTVFFVSAKQVKRPAVPLLPTK